MAEWVPLKIKLRAQNARHQKAKPAAENLRSLPTPFFLAEEMGKELGGGEVL